MKKYNLLSFILLGTILSNCGDTKNRENTIFNFDSSTISAQYQPQERLDLSILNPKAKAVDSIVYYINDTKIKTVKGLEKLSFELKNQKLGYQNIKAVVYFEGENAETTTRIEVVSNITPKLLQFNIVNTYPHDTNSFTEGFEFYNDTLYESTGSGTSGSGIKCTSYLRKYDYRTGKIFKQIDMDTAYFGEGITFINGKLFQLTWQDKKGFIFNANTLQLEKTFTYEKEIEGWGMTHDDKYIYQSDGTEKIWKMNPNTQKMVDYINVYSGSSKIKSVNELELIDGKFYANIWQKDAIAVINATNGAVEGILDLSTLRKLTKATPDDVLNGIAYNPKTKTVFVTGKNWDKTFEIKINE
ncbi:glutaminyl-peptide cyclotransferase [Flavobacterium nitratireducens]|uniref:glutaminyl-peptide cyclotransferase n=1 Tax=Flavobacterium nitratireducens TaxID=992289 RepID=UPI002415651C|nr:glutaminyl-peptide cyclotransferase [Flavobacterium nitratireducens]